MEETNSQVIEIPYGFSGRIYRSPMPFSLYDRSGEIWTTYRERDVGLIVVLTEPREYLVHAGKDLLSLYKENTIKAVHFPIKDLSVPEDKMGMNKLILDVIQEIKSGINIAVHCLAGNGRTGIFLACLAKRHFKMTGKESIVWIRQYVPNALENIHQENYVLQF